MEYANGDSVGARRHWDGVVGVYGRYTRGVWKFLCGNGCVDTVTPSNDAKKSLGRAWGRHGGTKSDPPSHHSLCHNSGNSETKLSTRSMADSAYSTDMRTRAVLFDRSFFGGLDFIGATDMDGTRWCTDPILLVDSLQYDIHSHAWNIDCQLDGVHDIGRGDGTEYPEYYCYVSVDQWFPREFVHCFYMDQGDSLSCVSLELDLRCCHSRWCHAIESGDLFAIASIRVA